MKAPKHLIHIGYPKAGSSFLRAWFAQHPKLFYQDGGIAGFSDIYELVRAGASKESNKYDYFVTSSEAIAVTNVFAGIPNTNFGFKNQKFNQQGDTHKLCMTLHGLFPNSKILFITRGFEAFAKSSYSQYIRSGGIHSKEELLGINKKEIKKVKKPKFQQILQAFIENSNATKIPDEYIAYLRFCQALYSEENATQNGYTPKQFLEDFPKIQAFILSENSKLEDYALTHLSDIQKQMLLEMKQRNGTQFRQQNKPKTTPQAQQTKYNSYNDIIRLYRQQFGEENVLIMPYELLKENQKRFLQILQERLGIETVAIELGIVNPSLSPQDLYWRRWLSRGLSQFSSILHERIFRFFYGKYVQLLQVGRLDIFFSLLKRIAPNREMEAFHLPESELNAYKGEASLLKHDPLYQSYLKEYLLDD